MSVSGGGNVWSSIGEPGAYTLTATWSPRRTDNGSGSVHALPPGGIVTACRNPNVARRFDPGTSAGESVDGWRPAHTDRTVSAVAPNGLLSRTRSPVPLAVTVRTLRTVTSDAVPCTPSSADSVNVTECAQASSAGAASAIAGVSSEAETAKTTAVRRRRIRLSFPHTGFPRCRRGFC